ncbi:MAG TPA: OmpA family protein [Stellaceae bacterium]|nr:OmpA family protein [Stellaceae bacterium]
MRRNIAIDRRRLAGHQNAGAAHDYFASMTDMMLGLVFIFIVILMVVAGDIRPPQVVEAAAAQPAAPIVSDLTEANLARRDLLRDIAKNLDGALPVTIDEENGTLQLGGDVLFPTASADPYPAALPKLRILAAALAKVLPCYAVSANIGAAPSCDNRHKARLDAVYIEGHTDATPIHTARFQSNWDLSAARASQTFAQLVAGSPSLAGLKNDQAAMLIGVSGYGEYRPVDTTGTPEGLRRNRRIELRFIMATPSAPLVAGLVARVNVARAP